MRVQDVNFLFDYDHWATQRIISKAQELPEDDLMQPTDFPWGSLFGTLVHMLDSQYVWRIILTEQRFGERLTDIQQFTSLQGLQEYWREESARMRQFINTLSDDDMDNVISYDVPEGMVNRVMWHCLTHIVNHGTQHRSECAQMLTQLGHSPGNMDFTVFLNQQSKK